ncbi:hypothetical protein HPG69_018204 [Diceros bicornis minor]|uniref:Uncharacterized protein n=1 Tax=Diceros bicornis minor TaxID=77932 RepID=A0A7J7FN09_DICBM|nr:hypothetical protein HPG69_018204 [Diceros bicornis minor]
MEFCKVNCTMKENLMTHDHIKHSGNNFRCLHRDFLSDSKATHTVRANGLGEERHRKIGRMAELDAKRTFNSDICDASFMCENFSAAIIGNTVNTMRIRTQMWLSYSFRTTPQTAHNFLNAASAALNIVPPVLVTQNPQGLSGTGELQIFFQISLISPLTQTSGCSSSAGVMAQLTTATRWMQPLWTRLSPVALGGPQEGFGHQPFITISDITCTDFEGLNTLIQKKRAEVTMVSIRGQKVAMATVAPSIYSPPLPSLNNSSSFTPSSKEGLIQLCSVQLILYQIST